MRISDWSSDVCASDLYEAEARQRAGGQIEAVKRPAQGCHASPREMRNEGKAAGRLRAGRQTRTGLLRRSEEHTSELQSLMRISYAVFCLQQQNVIPHSGQFFENCTVRSSAHTFKLTALNRT